MLPLKPENNNQELLKIQIYTNISFPIEYFAYRHLAWLNIQKIPKRKLQIGKSFTYVPASMLVQQVNVQSINHTERGRERE